MHEPYEKRMGCQADFRVAYTFYESEQGGRKTLPYQGIRSDFWYDYEGHDKNKIFMIWPEFEDEFGNVILNNDVAVPKSGTARMWIIVPERRIYHRDKIIIGLKGYFREGPYTTGICNVIEIVGLSTNPVR